MTELTQNYRTFCSLQYEARKAKRKGEVAPELIAKINEQRSALTDFELDYYNWVSGLYTDEIDVKKIKLWINTIASYLAEKDYDKEVLKQCRFGQYFYPSAHSYDSLYTRLCALRAAMRGRMHFADKPNSNWRMSYEEQKKYVEDLAESFTFDT